MHMWRPNSKCTDVGGGSTPNTDRGSLANIPFRWMVQEIVRSKCGILLDPEAYGQWSVPITIGQDIHPPTSLAASQAGGSDNCTMLMEDQVDAVEQQPHDQLQKNIFWWIPEIFLSSFTYQDVQNKWVTKWR